MQQSFRNIKRTKLVVFFSGFYFLNSIFLPSEKMHVRRFLHHNLESFKSFVVNIQDKSKKEINFAELIKICNEKHIQFEKRLFSLHVN